MEQPQTKAVARIKNSTEQLFWPGLDSEFYQIENKLAARGVPRQPSEPLADWLERAQADRVTIGLANTSQFKCISSLLLSLYRTPEIILAFNSYESASSPTNLTDSLLGVMLRIKNPCRFAIKGHNPGSEEPQRMIESQRQKPIYGSINRHSIA